MALLTTSLEDRGDRVRFVMTTADPVARERLPHLGYLAIPGGRFATRWFPATAQPARHFDHFAASIETIVRQSARLVAAPWEDALREFLDRVGGSGLDWWLYGSAALAVRGLPVAPGDIDVRVDDAALAGRVFDDLLVTPVERLDGWVAGYAGRAFCGAVVEWIAEPHAALDDPAAPHEQGVFVADRIETVAWRGRRVRVPPLEAQLRVCERRGLTERAALIRAAMRDGAPRSYTPAMTRTDAPSLAPAALRLGTEGAFAVLARAREIERSGRDVVHLEIGEPDFPTPAHASEAAFAAIRAGETGYCPAPGIPELREAAAAEIARTRRVPVGPERVLIANGAKPFLLYTVLATCEPGDEVMYPDPGFPIYESAIRFAGATPVPLALREADDFAFSVDEMAARLTDRTKLVILNSPHNPTGGVLARETLAAAAEVLRDSPAWVLSDEVYGRLLYDGEFASIATEPGMLERTIVLDSFSKTYAMTGWRCGYAAVPAALVEPFTRFLVNSTSCVPPFVQRAGVAALTGPQDDVAAMLAEFRARRELVVTGLAALPGVTCRVPHGAFYAFPNVESLPLGADVLAERLLEEAGVALLSGTAFGAAGEDHLRLSYATSRERLAEGLSRMFAFLATL